MRETRQQTETLERLRDVGLGPGLALAERDLWKVYRTAYQDEPFVRIVKERQGVYRYPEPKILAGANYCDIGFAGDGEHKRLVVIAASTGCKGVP